MAFKLKLDEPIESGVRRIGVEQIQRIRRQITAGSDPASEIHDARKSIKRIRALLRLAREGLGEAVFQAENARFRSIAAILAPARDAHVLRQTLARLAADGAGPASAALGRLANAASQEDGAAPASATPDTAAALAALDRAESRMRRLKIEPNDFSTVERGLVRSYRQGRARFETAYRTGSDEAFHQWRKSVQTHWRHMSLLARASPALFEAHVAAARELSQILGDDHDIAVLRVHVATRPEGTLTAKDAQAIERLVRTRLGELRKLAKPRGQMIYAERAGAHGRRISGVWQGAVAAHRLEDASRAPSPSSARRKEADPPAEPPPTQ